MSNPKRSWSGDTEMQGLFEELCKRETTHAKEVFSAKLKALVNIAFKYQNEFKMVVYEVESFIKKTATQNKIFGLYIIDSICRKSRSLNPKEKDLYSNRFALRLKETIGFFEKISSKEKITLRKIVDEWGKQDIFPRELIQTFKIEDKKSARPTFAQSPDDSSDGGEAGEGGAFESIMSRARPPPPSQPFLPPPKPPAMKPDSTNSAPTPIAAAVPMDPRRRGAAAAVVPAPIAVAVPAPVVSESVSTALTNSQANPSGSINNSICISKPTAPRPIKEVKKAVRLCPFREGNCPFSDKCRFSHYESNSLESYTASRMASKSASVKDGLSDLRRFTLLDSSKKKLTDSHLFDERYHHNAEEFIPQFKRIRALEMDPDQNFSFQNAGKVFILSKIQFDQLL